MTRKIPYRLGGLASVVRAPSRRTLLRWIPGCAFFVLYYFYVREFLDPRLLYHANKVALPSGQWIDFPICLRGTAFLKEFLARPGGLAEYVAAYCCQYYYYTHLGPLILTAIAWFAYLLTDRLIRVSGGTGGRGLRFAPPLLLLIAYNRYTFHLENHVALIAALMLATFYDLVAKRLDKAPVSLLLFAAASVTLYYAAGGPFILFAVLCAVPELLTRRRYVLGGLYLLGGAGIPLLGKHFFDVTVADAYFRPSGVYPFREGMNAAVLSALYLFFVFLVIALPFRQRLARLASAVLSRTGKVGKYCLNDRLRTVYAIALVMAGASVALYTLDEGARRVLRANYLARMGMWEEFLKEVERYPSQEYPGSVMLDLNRALFETNQLGSRMFSYRQNPYVLFELGARAVSYKGGCHVLLRLGRINEAEHAALEALELDGERAETLRQLAIIYIVKRQPEAARVFLGTLSKDIVHGQWAKGCLRRLDDDPLLSCDRQIQYLRSVMPLSDMVVTSAEPVDASTRSMTMKEAILLTLLARNRNNRMAFEYLMAYYLLTRQPGKVACSIGRLDDFDYPAVPEHYAEAILLYGYRVGCQIDVAGRTIEKPTQKRVREVIQIVHDCDGDKKAIADVLAARFPESYCRYLLTGESGGAR